MKKLNLTIISLILSSCTLGSVSATNNEALVTTNNEKGVVTTIKKDEFKITKRTTRAEFDKEYIFGVLLCKDKEEFFNILRNKVKLYEKYGRPCKDGKNEEILVDEQFVKDYKKLIIDPLLKIFHSTRAIFKDMLNKEDKVKFKEFV